MPAKKSVKVLRCPTCGTLVQQKTRIPLLQRPLPQDRPGQVGYGRLQISSPVLDPEVLEDLGGLTGGRNKGSEMSSPLAGVASPAVPAARKTFWAWTVATFFGAGLGKPGPGTWGSVAAVLLWAAYAWLVHPAPPTLFIALLIGIALSILLGVPAATIAARESGRHDPGFVVIDEVAGQWIALLGCPADWSTRSSPSSSFACSISPSPFPPASLRACPKAGASSSMMWPRGCMLWV